METAENQVAPELAAYLRQVQAIKQEFRQMTEGMTDVQFGWRPAAGVWSVSDCIVHLNLFGQQVEENIAAMMHEARANGLFHPGPYRHGLLGSLLIRTVEPPYKIRFKAVKRLLPADAAPMEQVVRDFYALHERLETLIRAADGIDLAGVRRPLPPTNMRLTLGQWLALCLAHERRHLWQARQICAQARFPH